ncbi:unnamed protein product [Knipowitschia caucasica]|uniref:Uncharacterized protein n=1 Tax=Knipowitschia caucasica TaxID=637954 RepID=A0AAV2JR43_KNICA
MRSLGGLALIVAAASVFLYLLSTHLPRLEKLREPGELEEGEEQEEYRQNNDREDPLSQPISAQPISSQPISSQLHKTTGS